ncbi:MAG: AAA family ATPase [Kiritimatiellae bacterium]|nr:AAA family ATPase [Kiritimatiellia bacterium]
MSDSSSSSKSSSRPMYYGGSSRALYYGGSSPQAYSSPAYSSYGASYYYGGAYGGSSGGGGGDDDSLMGQMTIGRMVRVCMQRWVTIVVFIIIGFIVSFAIYKISPVIYEAESLIEMRIRGASYTGLNKAVMELDMGSNMAEVFNTRLARLVSREVFEQIVTQYRSDNPSSTVKDAELYQALSEAKLTLQRQSRLIHIAVRSTNPALAADLANAYSKVAVNATSDQNRNESEVAVAWLANTTEEIKQSMQKANRRRMEFATHNQIESMRRRKTMQSDALLKISSDIMSLESRIAVGVELQKTLELVQNTPERFGSLPDSVPRTGEIAHSYQQWLNAQAEKNSLLARYTANHPDVVVKERAVEIYKNQFHDTVARSLETCKANLDLMRRQLDPLKARQEEINKELAELEVKIDQNQVELEQLDLEREVADMQYKALLKRKNEAQLSADEDTAIIKPVTPALKPNSPILPNPMVIFPAGPAVGLILGFLFVMMLDHLEDKIVGISDIESRLRLKVLAVMPHVRRKKREQLARLVSDDKFSQYAEAIAGLRNLLDSPRYHDMSKVLLCMSTMPGEGKTVTSCSLAQSCAQSGQKTLLVDFDMRRPRLARIFEKSHKDYLSLSHSLSTGDESVFDKLPVASGVDKNLSLILSRAASDVNPANIMGSDMVVQFFKWARENFDRIIIDSPPFGIVGDVMTLASLVDSVMIMCCPDRTRFQPIKHAARQLSEAGAHVIGVIVNDIDFGRRSQFGSYDYHYRYSYGGRYGYGYGYAPVKEKSATPSGKGKKSPEISASTEVDDVPSPAVEVERQDVVDASMTDDD